MLKVDKTQYWLSVVDSESALPLLFLIIWHTSICHILGWILFCMSFYLLVPKKLRCDFNNQIKKKSDRPERWWNSSSLCPCVLLLPASLVMSYCMPHWAVYNIYTPAFYFYRSVPRSTNSFANLYTVTSTRTTARRFSNRLLVEI